MSWLFAIGRGLRLAGKWLLDHPTMAILTLFALHVAVHALWIDPRLRGERDDAIALAAAEKDAHVQSILKYREAARQAEAAQQENLARVAAEQAAVTEREVNDYKARIGALRARYERLLEQQAGAGAGIPGAADLPGAGTASGGADPAAEDNGLPASGERNGPMSLWERLVASEQAEQLDKLIDYVIGQSQISMSPVPAERPAP